VILKGSQRGGAGQLAAHLSRLDDNEHVTLHEVRGFVSEDLHGALREAQAVSKGTRCRQFLFSVSLNPPEHERVSTQAFEDAVDRIEHRTGLAGHPRIVLFHEKEGRRHAHAVWSRIDAETMTAAWSKGRSQRYAYYFCQTKGCLDRRRNIRKQDIEGGFDDLLKSLRPEKPVLAAFRAMLREAFEKRQARSGQRLEAVRAELTATERKSVQLMERLMNADSAAPYCRL